MIKINLYLLIIIFLSACQSDVDTAALDKMLHGQDVAKDEALSIIEKAYNSIESSKLDSTVSHELRSGVSYDYTIYRRDGKPVKITYDINEDTYTVKANYYVHDTIPYYIHGTMRDRDRASGRYTHQELYTYLDGKKVIKQLKKTGINRENRSSDLRHIEKVDNTSNIKQPDLDASMKLEEVKTILRMQ